MCAIQGRASTWNMWRSCLASFKGCTGKANSKEQASVWRLCSGSSAATAGAFGQRANRKRAQHSIFLYLARRIQMTNDNIDVLLVEDNPRDAELTIRAFKKNNLTDRLFHAQDGAEALDF